MKNEDLMLATPSGMDGVVETASYSQEEGWSDFLETKLFCPYCGKSFLAKELEFIADVHEFHSSVEQTEETDAASPPSQLVRERGEEGEPLTDAVNSSQQYGKSGVPDVVLHKFLDDYSSGVVLHRTGCFYKISSCLEAQKDGQCGYVLSPDVPGEWEGNRAPLKLHVPTRREGAQVCTARICPHCHCDLDPGFFKVEASCYHTIALAGGTASGKTQFITTALKDLPDMLLTMNLGRAKIGKCSQWFLEVYKKQITSTGGIVATQTSHRLFPLLVQLSSLQNEDLSIVLFYDVAGEYASIADYAANAIGFQKATQLLLMMDSSFVFKAEAKLEEYERCTPVDVLSALDPIKSYNLCPQCHSVYVVLTKLDTIIGSVIKEGVRGLKGDALIIYENNYVTTHTNGVDLQELINIDDEIERKVLNQNQVMPNLRENIQVEFKNKDQNVNVFFLGVSTKISQKGPDGTMIFSPIQKDYDETTAGRHRLVEPLLAAFANLRLLPVKKPSNRNEEKPPRKWWERLFRCAKDEEVYLSH